MIKILFLLFSFSHADQIIGEAYVDGKLAYIEKHQAEVDYKGRYQLLKTDYLSPDRKNIFATITSDFNKNSFIPEVSFKDDRFNLIENISYDQSENSLKVLRITKEHRENYIIKLENPMILGQGFHNFIIVNFDKIKTDLTPLNIVVTSKKDFYRFIVEKVNVTDEYVEFQVYPKNFLLKQVVAPIKLKYSLKEKRLLNFKGLSKLENSKGDSQYVDIIYKYET